MTEIITALMGLVGSIIVAILSYLGNSTAAKKAAEANRVLIEYRMTQLEQKVDKHNNLVERVYGLEGRMTEAEHDLRDLKGVVYHE